MQPRVRICYLVVQFAEEKDVKRREAVRRKTAQYLLKAEALYNAYLTNNESQDEKPEQVLTSSAFRTTKTDTEINFTNRL